MGGHIGTVSFDDPERFPLPSRQFVPASDPAFKKSFSAAEGYFQLGMWQDAWDELEGMAPECRHLSQVILLRVLILNSMGKWESAATIGTGALRHYSEYGALYLATADALRHSRGVPEAKALLLDGESALESEAVFHFILAGYECQLGDLHNAKLRLGRAFKLNKHLRAKAFDEPDLAPLWDLLGGEK